MDYYGWELYPGVKQQIRINDDETYDIHMSDCNSYINTESSFCKSEKGGYEGINRFLHSTVEVKFHLSAIDYNSLFVEYQTYFRKENENRLSGIHTSEADCWWFEMGEVSIRIDTEYLKWLYTNRNTLNFEEKPSHDHSHVATGFIVPIGLILPLLKKYKDEKNMKRIREVYENKKNI